MTCLSIFYSESDRIVPDLPPCISPDAECSYAPDIPEYLWLVILIPLNSTCNCVTVHEHAQVTTVPLPPSLLYRAL